MKSSSTVFACFFLVFASQMDRAQSVAQTPYVITLSEKNLIQDTLNGIRQLEGASNMNELYWGEDLAIMAQSWAARCDFSEDLSSAFQSRSIGQSRYATNAAEFSVQTIFDYLQRSRTACTSGNTTSCDFYKLVVWPSSELVGCGYNFCESLTGSNLDNAHYFVCSYSPVGNFRFENAITLGDACSDCTDLNCDQGLCDWRNPIDAPEQCQACFGGFYSCLDCHVDYRDSDYLYACPVSRNLDVEVIPNKASTDRVVDITLNINGLKEAPASDIYEIGAVALLAPHVTEPDQFRLLTQSYNSEEVLRILEGRPILSRDQTSFTFSAWPIAPDFEGVPWQLSLVINQTTICELKANLTFYGRPTIEEVTPRRTVLSGGTRVSVKGRSFNAVEQAFIVIVLYYTDTENVTSITDFRGDCIVKDNNNILCTTPEIRLPGGDPVRRVKRQISDENTVNNEEFEFDIYIEFDGETEDLSGIGGNTQENCNGICVFHDPHIEGWSPDEREFDDSMGFITIEGTRLNLGVRSGDYDISVGEDGFCQVTELLQNRIVCEPPDSKPELINDGSERDNKPRVQVRVGSNLAFFVGYLAYKDTSIPWVIIGAAAGGGVLVILLIVCACWCGCRNSGSSKPKGTHGKNLNTSELQMEAATSSNGTDNKGYVSPVSETQQPGNEGYEYLRPPGNEGYEHIQPSHGKGAPQLPPRRH